MIPIGLSGWDHFCAASRRVVYNVVVSKELCVRRYKILSQGVDPGTFFPVWLGLLARVYKILSQGVDPGTV
jgi:hypothetical protein